MQGQQTPMSISACSSWRYILLAKMFSQFFIHTSMLQLWFNLFPQYIYWIQLLLNPLLFLILFTGIYKTVWSFFFYFLLYCNHFCFTKNMFSILIPNQIYFDVFHIVTVIRFHYMVLKEIHWIKNVLEKGTE